MASPPRVVQRGEESGLTRANAANHRRGSVAPSGGWGRRPKGDVPGKPPRHSTDPGSPPGFSAATWPGRVASTSARTRASPSRRSLPGSGGRGSNCGRAARDRIRPARPARPGDPRAVPGRRDDRGDRAVARRLDQRDPRAAEEGRRRAASAGRGRCGLRTVASGPSPSGDGGPEGSGAIRTPAGRQRSDCTTSVRLQLCLLVCIIHWIVRSPSISVSAPMLCAKHRCVARARHARHATHGRPPDKRRQSTAAPAMVLAWIADESLDHPESATAPMLHSFPHHKLVWSMWSMGRPPRGHCSSDGGQHHGCFHDVIDRLTGLSEPNPADPPLKRDCIPSSASLARIARGFYDGWFARALRGTSWNRRRPPARPIPDPARSPCSTIPPIR